MTEIVFLSSACRRDLLTQYASRFISYYYFFSPPGHNRLFCSYTQLFYIGIRYTTYVYTHIRIPSAPAHAGSRAEKRATRSRESPWQRRGGGPAGKTNNPASVHNNGNGCSRRRRRRRYTASICRRPDRLINYINARARATQIWYRCWPVVETSADSAPSAVSALRCFPKSLSCRSGRRSFYIIIRNNNIAALHNTRMVMAVRACVHAGERFVLARWSRGRKRPSGPQCSATDSYFQLLR